MISGRCEHVAGMVGTSTQAISDINPQGLHVSVRSRARQWMG